MKENSYYILKAQATKSRSNYTFYKIGEADKIARPQDLCGKYTKVDNRINSITTQLDYQPLPHNSTKRLNDKTIHKALDKNIFKKVDPFLIEGIFGETDGYDEFFEVLDKNLTDADIIKLVADTVANLAKDPNNFTAKLPTTNNIVLDYKQQKHLVDNNIVEQIEKRYNLHLISNTHKNILLIGQFLPDWIATFALYNDIVIWHDTKDQVITYGYEKLNKQIKYINDLQEIIDMEIIFDYIIANPPYGAVGANITDTIRENVDYTEFVNLLPANDYKRNKNKDLFNYQSDMIAINNGFADALVTTHCALISKNKVNNLTAEEFERSTYVDKSLEKYFEVLSTRQHYAIDNATSGAPKNKDFDFSTSLFVAHRTAAAKHFTYKKDCAAYQLNFNLLTYAEAVEKYGLKNDKANRLFDAGICTFNTKAEKTHVVNFIYSTEGAKFLAKVFTATNTDSWLDINKWLPKVDWTRSWTVEEILAEYGYTQAEIKEIINDLDNFKGMN